MINSVYKKQNNERFYNEKGKTIMTILRKIMCLMLILCMAVSASMLTACDLFGDTKSTTAESPESLAPDAEKPRFEDVYELAQSVGYTGTLEELIELFKGEDGVDGLTPYIGKNGNWWIGKTDTKVPAQGSSGTDGADGKDGID